MKKQIVKIRYQNGINKEIAEQNILNDLLTDFEFVETENPDFILFGPYGNDIPPAGNYTRIGYFCENIKPDFSVCEWAFGIPREEDIRHPNYKRIQWHGLDPQRMVKPQAINAGEILASKTRFCNFLYSHPVPYRERFFRELSKYKKVDAPGKSMNNMPPVERTYQGDKWEAKRRFLAPYKFTIAFENDIFPGYQTEKLYDAMQVQSMPIYCGDPFIGDVFNTGSFVNVFDYVPYKNHGPLKWLTAAGQMDFEDIRPAFLKSPANRLKRKIKTGLRGAKNRLMFSDSDFKVVIEKIIELDNNPDLYMAAIKQPWFKNNTVPAQTYLRNRWKEIFCSAK